MTGKFTVESTKVYSKSQEKYVKRFYIADIRGVRISKYMTEEEANKTLFDMYYQEDLKKLKEN